MTGQTAGFGSIDACRCLALSGYSWPKIYDGKTPETAAASAQYLAELAIR
jgi:hypothetical protein